MKYLKTFEFYNDNIILFKNKEKLKKELSKDKDFKNDNIFQSLLNLIYAKWHTENKWNYQGIIKWTTEELGDLPLLALYIASYNYQVGNGGHFQYFDNGFASSVNKGSFSNYDDIQEHENFEDLFIKLNLVDILPSGKEAYYVISSFVLDMEDAECDDCGGEGTNECYDCDGNGTVECPECNGEGEDREGETCYNCDGNGHIECDECNGQGYVNCDYCRGTGYNDRRQKPATYDWEKLDDRWYKISDDFVNEFNDYLKMELNDESIDTILAFYAAKKYNL